MRDYEKAVDESYEQWFRRQKRRGFVKADDGSNFVREDDEDDSDIERELEEEDEQQVRSAAAAHASDMADLIVEHSGCDRGEALAYLLHTADGRALLVRSLGKRLTKKKEQTMTNP
jgi:hypothetical protein